MKIFVKTLKEKTLTLEVEKNDSIENIQSKIKDLEGDLYKIYILSFEDKILENNKILLDYNIQNESIIYIKNSYEVNYYKQFL
jgi:large subunit ribosomal protein L40e